jgi:multidrug efflux pump subunit AcrA (membrane-fusion protein)
MTKPAERKGVALAVLLDLEKRARAATSVEELGFLMANDTHLVAPYRQAAFYRADRSRLQTLSSLATPDRDAPFTRRLEQYFRKSLAASPRLRAMPVTAMGEAFGASDTTAATEAAAFFSRHLPASVVLVPLIHKGLVEGALLFAREEPFNRGELGAFTHLSDAYAHALAALSGPHRHRKKHASKRMVAAAVIALMLGLLAIPVRQSVLAPAEIIASDATVIRSPLQGVVEHVHVTPNQRVDAGTALVSLDGGELATRLEIARQQLAVADAELRQARQQALFDERSRAQLAILQGRREQHAAELAFLHERIARIHIAAPSDGIAIFDDVADWEGRPVALGERIMLLADPDRRELEMNLAVADAINLQPGAEIRFFLNIDPARPVMAQLERAGYRATQTAEGIMAYRVRARFEDDDARLRIGLRGTARIYGDRTVLGLYLLRRPLAWGRLWLGW